MVMAEAAAAYIGLLAFFAFAAAFMFCRDVDR
jgi:hypothetical protein